MAETIEALIRELNAKVVTDHGLKLAMEPKVTIPNEETEVAKVIGGQSDLAYTLAVEVLPKIELADFKGIKLERSSDSNSPLSPDSGCARCSRAVFRRKTSPVREPC